MRAARGRQAEAAALARRVSAPWFRCQALAYAARYAPEEESVSLLAREAVEATLNDADAFTHVAASAWSVRALIERGFETEARTWVARLLPLADRIEPPSSQQEALFFLWQSALPLGLDTLGSLHEDTVNACLATDFWRARRNLRDLVCMLLAIDREKAEALLARMPEDNYRRVATRAVADGSTMEPRSFFRR